MENFGQHPFDPSSSTSRKSSSPSSRNSFSSSSFSSSTSCFDDPQADQLPNVPSRNARREYMFEKAMTPSDVGKLNRLVIPKQYAEKFFPLDQSSATKGLILSFEDRTGNQWRFRYSYWSSSQSYVMTRGWSRFVKEKQLTAGDTVTFCRGVDSTGQAHNFINWRRRRQQPAHPNLPRYSIRCPQRPDWGGQVFSELQLTPTYSTAVALNFGAPPVDGFSLHEQIRIGHASARAIGLPMQVLVSAPAANAADEPRRSVRLFGVNL